MKLIRPLEDLETHLYRGSSAILKFDICSYFWDASLYYYFLVLLLVGERFTAYETNTSPLGSHTSSATNGYLDLCRGSSPTLRRGPWWQVQRLKSWRLLAIHGGGLWHYCPWWLAVAAGEGRKRGGGAMIWNNGWWGMLAVSFTVKAAMFAARRRRKIFTACWCSCRQELIDEELLTMTGLEWHFGCSLLWRMKLLLTVAYGGTCCEMKEVSLERLTVLLPEATSLAGRSLRCCCCWGKPRLWGRMLLVLLWWRNFHGCCWKIFYCYCWRLRCSYGCETLLTVKVFLRESLLLLTV